MWMPIRIAFPYPESHFNFAVDMNSVAMMQNLLDLSDIIRDVGAELSPADKELEFKCWNRLHKYKLLGK